MSFGSPSLAHQSETATPCQVADSPDQDSTLQAPASKPQSDPDDIYDFDPYAVPSDLRFDEAFPEQDIKLEKRGLTQQITLNGDYPGKAEYQGNFWTKQTIFKNSIAAKLRLVGEQEIAADLETCHSYFTVARCNGCSRTSKFANRCDRFYCPECQPRLSRERKESVEWWTKQIGQPKHVVLTVRNTDDLTRAHVDQIKKWFTALRRRAFARNWKGGFYSLECTNEGRGWHLHIHALVDARYIDAGQLAVQWASVTAGAGYIVKVKDCRNKSYLQEVTKYAVGGNDLASWSGEQIQEFIQAFSGARQFGVFGSLFGQRTEWKEHLAKIKDDKKQCSCGSCSVSFFSEYEWEILQAQLSPQVASIPKPIPGGFEFSFVRDLDKLAKH